MALWAICVVVGLVTIGATSVPLAGPNATLLRCAYGQHRVLHLECRGKFAPFYGGDNNITHCQNRLPRDPNVCGFHWRGAADEATVDPSLFEGVPSIHFVGDSTVMRSYLHIINASEQTYTQKVKELADDTLNSSVRTPSGQKVPVSFHRSLHIALAVPIVRAIIRDASPRALIVLAYGPHDTSWLVFRRAMPFFNRKNNGRWSAAEHYWQRHASGLAKGLLDALSNRSSQDRPVVVVREHFYANCRHPKYSKYPLNTRCPDLLNPRVVPSYRRWFQTLLGEFNIPTVGLDGMFPPCHMVDAGHINRKCKGVEIQFLVQAYAEVRRSGVLQAALSPAAVDGRLWRLIGNQSLVSSRNAQFTQPLADPLPQAGNPSPVTGLQTEPTAIATRAQSPENTEIAMRSTAPEAASSSERDGAPLDNRTKAEAPLDPSLVFVIVFSFAAFGIFFVASRRP